MGVKSKNLTDEEINLLLERVEIMVRVSVREYIRSKNSKSPVTVANVMDDEV